jgi:hypothetical protein
MVAKSSFHSKRSAIIFLLVLIVIAGVAVTAILMTRQAQASLANLNTISQQMLEEKYGLHVNLLAVTAAGGMVDLRLKIIDADKAKLLLSDQNNFPSLVGGNPAVVLNVDEETKSQNIQFDPAIGLFLMYPNAGNAVKRGEPVTIVFGETRLEAVLAR